MRYRPELPASVGNPAANHKPTFKLLTTADLMQMPAPQWLVKGLIRSDGLGVIYGAPGEGKTFLTLSLMLSILHGVRCFDRRTDHSDGVIVYVAGEGVGGLMPRARAWLQHHGIDPNAPSGARYIQCPVPLLDPQAVEKVILDIKHEVRGAPVKMVIFDTLARCFGDGDENLQTDMNRFVAACSLIQRELSCAVWVVHHQPKGSDDMRGSSALPGAADTILRVSKTTQGLQVEVRKQKDGQDGIALLAQLETLDLGPDEDGEPVEMPVAVLDGGTVQVQEQNEPKSKNQTALLDVLRLAGAKGLTDREWRDAANAAGIGGKNPNRAFRESRDALLKDRHVVKEDGIYIAV